MELLPVIAIHGVGNHEPDRIRERVREAFQRAGLTDDISEFNWDSFADHSIRRVRDGVTLLNQTAGSISHAAALPLPATAGRVDRLLQRIGEGLYHSVFRVLVAGGLTLLLVGPLLQLLVQVPSAAFASIAWDSFAWIRTATPIVVLAGALTLLALASLDLARSAIAVSLAPLRVTARRAALLLLQPVILLLTVPVSVRFGSGLMTLAGSMVPLAFLSIALNLVISPLFGNRGELMTGIGHTGLLVAGAAAVGGLHVLLRNGWIGGPLKILLDIVRYMGAPAYRATVQANFDDRVKAALDASGDGGRQVVLLAHSLGTVIALDSLVNSTVWRSSDAVVLVTMGSPIRRFFIRFFPGYLFPASVDGAARLVASRLRAFTWINIHRRWDYVGTGLGVERAGLGADICTGQGWKLHRSHSNYWEDAIVTDRIGQALRAVAPVPREPAGASSTATTHVLPVVVMWPLSVRLAWFVRIVAVGLTVAVIVVAAVAFIQSRAMWRLEIEQELAGLRTSGVSALADVTYHRTVEGAGEDAYPLHHFVFAVPGWPRQLPPIEIPDNVVYDEHASRFDYRALAAFVLDGCVRAEQKRWWQIFRSEASIPCTRAGIPISYDVDAPESFWLPDFPARAGRLAGVGEAVAVLILFGFFAAGCALAILGGAVPLFRLFLGLTAVDRRE